MPLMLGVGLTGDAVAVIDTDGVDVGVPLALGVAVQDADRVPLVDALVDADGVTVLDGVVETLCVALAEPLGVTVVEGVVDELCVAIAVPLGVAVDDGVVEGLLVGVAVLVAVGVPDGVVELLHVDEVVPLGVTEFEGVTEEEPVTVPLTLRVTEVVGVPLGAKLLDDVAEAGRDGEGMREEVGVTLDVRLGVGHDAHVTVAPRQACDAPVQSKVPPLNTVPVAW